MPVPGTCATWRAEGPGPRAGIPDRLAIKSENLARTVKYPEDHGEDRTRTGMDRWSNGGI